MLGVASPQTVLHQRVAKAEGRGSEGVGHRGVNVLVIARVRGVKIKHGHHIRTCSGEQYLLVKTTKLAHI